MKKLARQILDRYKKLKLKLAKSRELEQEYLDELIEFDNFIEDIEE